MNTRVEERAQSVVNQVVEVEVSRIAPNPSQPRVVFDEYALMQLAVSIRQNGILQPLTVRLVKPPAQDAFVMRDAFAPPPAQYELIAGERRLRAAKLAGVERVPCIVMDATNENSALFAIMENIQRADLNYIEEAFAIKRLIEFLGITQEEAAVKLGLAQSTVANKLRLLRLSDREKAMVLRERLNERQARALLRLPDELRESAIRRISTEGLNTVQADKLIEELLKPAEPSTHEPRKRRAVYITNPRLYINTFNHTIDSMKKAGIACEASQSKTAEYVEYRVRILL
ncbi:MAG: ParB/RepB/Spo0J family partition protein [Oscillospiraceae bacterium]|nr:ParB/RepB/Spo0J family partition protein [Oscillospiraceae bacterium]